MANQPYDKALKSLVEASAEDWPALAEAPGGPARIIDADIATVGAAADKVLRVETDPPYLLHLEFHAGHDAAAQPRLLHKRNLLLEERYDLDVRTLLIVLHRKADSRRALTGLRKRTYPGERKPYTTFRYGVLRVWKEPPERFFQGGLGLLPLAPISAVTERQLPGIMEQMDQRLRGQGDRPLAATVWAVTYILMGVRYSEDVIRNLFRGVTAMEESVTYQEILRKGKAEGEAKGRAEGEAKGARDELKKVLLLQGEGRFGPADEQVRAALEAVQDLQQLEAMSLRLLTASSWTELLSGDRPRRRNGRRRSQS